MRKQKFIRFDLTPKRKTGFCCFKQLGITPQAVRLFFKQVVLTKSIPFAIENQNINMEQLLKLRKAKASSLNQNASTLNEDDDHEDLFEELNALLGESDKT